MVLYVARSPMRGTAVDVHRRISDGAENGRVRLPAVSTVEAAADGTSQCGRGLLRRGCHQCSQHIDAIAVLGYRVNNLLVNDQDHLQCQSGHGHAVASGHGSHFELTTMGPATERHRPAAERRTATGRTVITTRIEGSNLGI